MAIIIDRAFVLPRNPDRAFLLSNTDYMRKLAFGTNWNKLRLTVTVAINGPLVSITNGTKYAIGLCSGTVRGPSGIVSGQGVLNFVGLTDSAVALGSIGSSLSYGGGTPPAVDYYMVGSGKTACYQGVTAIGLGTATSAWRLPAANDPSLTYRFPLVIDITKGSPNYTVKWWYLASNTQNSDSYQGVTDTMAQQNDTYSETGIPVGSQTDTIACNESTGPFDSFCIYWNRVDYLLEVYDVKITRMY